MRHTYFEHSHSANLFRLAAAVLLSVLSFSGASMARQRQKTFSSPEDASAALAAAAQTNDENALLDGITLYVGAENWPLPMPIVNKDGAWYFDTVAGKREILYRRIGRNEMSVIRVCKELAAAEKEYYESEGQYASKILSDAGQHNGLYWRTGAEEPESPVGPLVASAVAEGYARRSDGAPTPYRGYYYRILSGQGPNSPGGPKRYIAGGKMTGGFAFVAYPAEYRSSGVMTFIVNGDGVVYQKDLGPKSGALAMAMREYNPGPGWQKAGDPQGEINAESLKQRP